MFREQVVFLSIYLSNPWCVHVFSFAWNYINNMVRVLLYGECKSIDDKVDLKYGIHVL